MDELLAVKRRAPPRLFRNRRQINERSASQRPVDAQWRRRQLLAAANAAAYLPALDLDMPHPSPADQGLSRPSGPVIADLEMTSLTRTEHRSAQPHFLPESSHWANFADCVEERTQAGMIGGRSGTQTPVGSSSDGSFVPSPQQIVQAMARSRIANASTPTTPRMSPWRKATWDTGGSRENLQTESQEASSSIPGHASQVEACRTSMVRPPQLRQWKNPDMPLHYVIAPEIRPLQVPSPGPKPLPVPSDAAYRGSEGTSRLAEVVQTQID